MKRYKIRPGSIADIVTMREFWMGVPVVLFLAWELVRSGY